MSLSFLSITAFTNYYTEVSLRFQALILAQMERMKPPSPLAGEACHELGERGCGEGSGPGFSFGGTLVMNFGDVISLYANPCPGSRSTCSSV